MTKTPKDSKTYNILWPVAVLEEIDRSAEDTNISRATFIKKAVADKLAALNAKPEELGTPPEEALPWDAEDDGGSSVPGDYVRGVEDACQLVEESPRLALRMATGGTMGDDIAKGIRKDLGL